MRTPLRTNPEGPQFSIVTFHFTEKIFEFPLSLYDERSDTEEIVGFAATEEILIFAVLVEPVELVVAEVVVTLLEYRARISASWLFGVK